MTDAVVIGAGPNGLTAANVLADEGWDVVVLEEQPEPGGAVRSDTFGNGFVRDPFSAFYPLAAASPVLRSFALEEHGLRWCRAPLVLAHPSGDGEPVVLSQDVEETAASLDTDHPGDGDSWRRMYREWERIGEDVVGALLDPFPPLRNGASLLARLGTGTLEFARFSLLSVRRLAEEHFGGQGAAMLLAGNSLHADFSPESSLSGFFGWLLCCLGQQHGFPVPEGGSGSLTAALVARLEARGGTVVCGARVDQIVVAGGRAAAVRTADGTEIEARRAVLADVGAPQLYRRLIAAEHLPAGVLRQIDRFQYDTATVKIDWALDGPIPWRSDHARRAGTIHAAEGIDHLSDVSRHLAKGLIPDRPYLVMGQMTTADPARSPAGTESAWAYTHVPQRVTGDAGGELTGSWDEGEAIGFASRVERVIEDEAPGFGALVRDRAILTPPVLERSNRNLVGGSTNGGTAQIHQQLIFRPVPGLGRPSTPVDRLFLASASAHPGGGVHGACGANAARAALAAWRRPRVLAAAALAAGAAAAGRTARRGR